MNPQSPLGQFQRKRLGEVAALGLFSDESFAAYLHQLGQPCARGQLTHYRQGARACPLGILDLLLLHCSGPEQVRVLDIWARPHGLCVVPVEAPVPGRDLVGWIIELGGVLGAAMMILRALLTRPPTDDERWRLRILAGELRRGAGQLEVLAVAPDAAPDAVPVLRRAA